MAARKESLVKVLNSLEGVTARYIDLNYKKFTETAIKPPQTVIIKSFPSWIITVQEEPMSEAFM
jgi:hypothetical protein